MNEMTIYISSLDGDGINRELKSAVNITDVSEVVIARFKYFKELTPSMLITTRSGKQWEIPFPYIDWDLSVIEALGEDGKPVENFIAVPLSNSPESLQAINLDNRSKFIDLLGKWIRTALSYKNWPEKPNITHVINIRKTNEAIEVFAQHLFAGMETLNKNTLTRLDIILYPKGGCVREFLEFDILNFNYQKSMYPRLPMVGTNQEYVPEMGINVPLSCNLNIDPVVSPQQTSAEKISVECIKFHDLLSDSTFLSVNNVAKWMDIDFKNYILYLDPIKMLNIIRTKCGINIELVGEDAAIESLTRVLSDGHDFHAVREQGGNLIRWQRKFRDADDNIIESAAEYLKLGCDYRKAEREKWFADYENKNGGNPPKEVKPSGGNYDRILRNLIGE